MSEDEAQGLINKNKKRKNIVGDKVISKQEHESNVIELLTFLTKEIRSLREEKTLCSHDWLRSLYR